MNNFITDKYFAQNILIFNQLDHFWKIGRIIHENNL